MNKTISVDALRVGDVLVSQALRTALAPVTAITSTTYEVVVVLADDAALIYRPGAEVEIAVAEIGEEGPGAYGGPAEERIATDAERAELRAAFWHESRLQTLWFHGSGECSGMYSVDEALALVRAA